MFWVLQLVIFRRYQIKMTTNKKGMGALGWIILIIILIAIGVGVYLWLSGGNLPTGIGGSSIPQPPALPSG